MTEEEMLKALAEVVARRVFVDGPDGEVDPSALVHALLPTVRRIVAAELRAAADEAHDEYSGWEAANVVRARADALDGAS